MEVADRLFRALQAHPGCICFGAPVTGVLLWRPISGTAGDVFSRLPQGSASLTRVGGTDWIRQVAANPMAYPEQLLAAIFAALAPG